jgi:tRNA (guanosine-2'-O-)-methyltransferase
MTPERAEKIKRVLSLRQPDLTVVMENIHDPHNISAVMRTCEAVGVQEIFVLNNTIKMHKKFGSRSSASAVGWLTIHQFEDTAECMQAIKQKYGKIFATHLGVQSSSLYSINLAESVALVFGNEKLGVTDDCLSYCDGNFIIPQAGMVQSLNISVACAVSLYEAYRQREVAGFYNGKCRLPETQRAALAKEWGLLNEECY